MFQVFYLDNIDFGTFNREHKLFPRVKHYSNETITRMIECDRCKENDVSSPPRYGRLQVYTLSKANHLKYYSWILSDALTRCRCSGLQTHVTNSAFTLLQNQFHLGLLIVLWFMACRTRVHKRHRWCTLWAASLL